VLEIEGKYTKGCTDDSKYAMTSRTSDAASNMEFPGTPQN